MPLLLLLNSPSTAPVNTGAPVVTGVPVTGQTLVTSNGTWTGTPTSYTYQWQDSPDNATWSNITSATAATYIISLGEVGDYVRCVVTAVTATSGSAAANSNSLGPVTAADPAVLVATAKDVPGKYDVVINGSGYILLDALTPSLPFRTHRAVYSHSATFIERSNVTGSYGDNQQAFWLTASQNDWALGEEQHYYRSNDDTKKRRYYLGSNIDVSVEGQAKLFGAASTITFAAASGAAISRNGGNALAASTTNLYEIDGAGTITDRGAHGATVSAVGKSAMCTDGLNVFISGDSLKVRKWNGSVFSDFSSTVASSLAFVSNTLFGVNASVLSKYDTSGVASTVYTWQAGDGTATTYGLDVQIKPYGGKIIALRPGVTSAPGELWLADNTGASQIAAFPTGFQPHGMCVVNGIVFVVGLFFKKNYGWRTEVWYYANGNIGRLWESNFYTNATVGRLAVSEYGNGVAFTDSPGGRLLAYDFAVGGVSTIAAFSASGASARVWIAPNNSGLLVTNDTTSGTIVPTAAAATTGFLETSLFDFDSSLTKQLRGITVDFDAATDGDGGSVDIKYAINGFGGTTTLATGVTSGTEYVPGVTQTSSGRSLSVRVVLNKGTSTNGPVLKRIYIRAVPVLQSYQNREYTLDLSGTLGQPRQLRDGSWDPIPAHQAAVNLNTAITATAPIQITDRFGTFTGILEPAQSEIYEMHADAKVANQSGQFIAKIVARQV